MVNLGEFRDELRGQRIAGRVVDGTLKPYQDRTQIELGKLPKDQDRALLYVDSAVEAFFLQIQGSGVVTLPDGTTRRVGFDGQNGHVYSAVGGELIRRGHLTKDTVSMQSIKSWMEQNPAEARDVMRTNKSYVFFRFIDGDHTVSGPIGGEGIPLTAERSIAIDSGIYPYGIPFFLDAEHPLDGQQRLQRLMIGQDTGGAIRGGVRGDYFWGHGNAAERAAGPMKSSGRFWILRPKS
jgi:membrane-bound lytic murein transglycosylase A